MEPKVLSLDSNQIQEYQVNRYPYLMIDRVTEVLPGKYVKGYKNLTTNEWYFPIHFQGNAIMPGALQMEALAQMFSMTFATLPEYKGKVTNFLEAKSMKCFHPITPGDRLDMESELVSMKRGVAKGFSKGYVEGKLVCSAEFVIVIPEVIQQFSPMKGE